MPHPDIDSVAPEYIANARLAEDRRGPPVLPTFVKVVVLDVITDPFNIISSDYIDKLQDKYGTQLLKQYAAQVPRNTIVGQMVRSEDNDFYTADSVRFYLPFFPPHLSLPCSPGEHVWALQSNHFTETTSYGYWICRITEFLHADDVNHTHPPRSYEASMLPGYSGPPETTNEPFFNFYNGNVIRTQKGEEVSEEVSSKRYIPGGPDAYMNLLDEGSGNASALTAKSPVARFRKRPGDTVFEGTNNTLIVLGTDRAGPALQRDEVAVDTPGSFTIAYNDNTTKSFKQIFPAIDKKFGSIDIVAGKTLPHSIVGNSLGNLEIDKTAKAVVSDEHEGDFNLAEDKSRIRLSELSSCDINFGIDSYNIDMGVEDSDEGDPSVVLKSDKIRLIARKDVELLVNDNDGGDGRNWASVIIKANGDIIIKPSQYGYIRLGGEGADKALLCSASPATLNSGSITHMPLTNNMGGTFATGKSDAKKYDQGTFSSKVLVT